MKKKFKTEADRQSLCPKCKLPFTKHHTCPKDGIEYVTVRRHGGGF